MDYYCFVFVFGFRAKVETADVRYNDLKTRYDDIESVHAKQLRAAIAERDDARLIVKHALEIIEQITTISLTDHTGKHNSRGVEVKKKPIFFQ